MAGEPVEHATATPRGLTRAATKAAWDLLFSQMCQATPAKRTVRGLMQQLASCSCVASGAPTASGRAARTDQNDWCNVLAIRACLEWPIQPTPP